MRFNEISSFSRWSSAYRALPNEIGCNLCERGDSDSSASSICSKKGLKTVFLSVLEPSPTFDSFLETSNPSAFRKTLPHSPSIYHSQRCNQQFNCTYILQISNNKDSHTLCILKKRIEDIPSIFKTSQRKIANSFCLPKLC